MTSCNSLLACLIALTVLTSMARAAENQPDIVFIIVELGGGRRRPSASICPSRRPYIGNGPFFVIIVDIVVLVSRPTVDSVEPPPDRWLTTWRLVG